MADDVCTLHIPRLPHQTRTAASRVEYATCRIHRDPASNTYAQIHTYTYARMNNYASHTLSSVYGYAHMYAYVFIYMYVYMHTCVYRSLVLI